MGLQLIGYNQLATSILSEASLVIVITLSVQQMLCGFQLMLEVCTECRSERDHNVFGSVSQSSHATLIRKGMSPIVRQLLNTQKICIRSIVVKLSKKACTKWHTEKRLRCVFQAVAHQSQLTCSYIDQKSKIYYTIAQQPFKVQSLHTYRKCRNIGGTLNLTVWWLAEESSN